MNRDVLLAGVLLSISTMLKIFSVVALCQSPIHIDELEHTMHVTAKSSQQTTHLRIRKYR